MSNKKFATAILKLGIVKESGDPLQLKRDGQIAYYDEIKLLKFSTTTMLFTRRGEAGEWDQSLETETNSTFYQVNDLAPFTTYSFRVSAVNPAGVSPLSKISYYMLTLREGLFMNVCNDFV